MKRPKLIDNYHGFDHEVVKAKFEGNPTYIGDACVNFHPMAIYQSKKPNRKKGHKDYMLLTIDSRGPLVMGMDKAEMVSHSIHDAVHCTQCDTLLYSIDRHHFNSCGCPNGTFIDGGKDYTRSGGDLANMVHGTYDVLKKKFTPKK